MTVKTKLICPRCGGQDSKCPMCPRLTQMEADRKLRKKCPKCAGKNPKCELCCNISALERFFTEEKRKQKEKDDIKTRRLRYLADIWVKARKFLLTDLNGSPEFMAENKQFDPEILKKLLKEMTSEFGPWISPDGERMPMNPEVTELLIKRL